MGDGKWQSQMEKSPFPISHFPFPIRCFSAALLRLALALAATLQVHEAEAADQKRRDCEKH
jgi:hypothetical protein